MVNVDNVVWVLVMVKRVLLLRWLGVEKRYHAVVLVDAVRVILQ